MTERHSVSSTDSKPSRNKGAKVPESSFPGHELGMRVAAAVEIQNVELIFGHFTRKDDRELLPPGLASTLTPEIGIDPHWKLSKDRRTLGVKVVFATLFPGELEGGPAPPYSVIAGFRVTYALPTSSNFSRDEFESFVRWQSVFNVWPYWREFLSSTINRAGLPRFAAPLMKLPMGEQVVAPEGWLLTSASAEQSEAGTTKTKTKQL